MRRGLLLLSLSVACRGPTPTLARTTPGVQPEIIKIGSYGPLSGSSAAWGEMLRGIEAYFAFINVNGGVHGRRLELVVADDQYDATKTPAAVRRLVEDEQVFALLAGIGTATGLSVADYLERAGVPFFSPASGARIWTEPGKQNVRTVYPRHVTEGQLLARHVVQALGKKRVAVFYQDDEFGREGLHGVQTELEARGLTLVAQSAVAAHESDLEPALTEIGDAVPEAVILFVAPRHAVAFVQALHTRALHPQIATSFVLSAPIIMEKGGADWEGVITAMAAKDPLSEDPASVQLRRVLAEHSPGLSPSGFTVTGFRLAMPFAEALHRAGPELTRANFLAALETFDGYEGGGPYWVGPGLIGPVRFRGGRRHGHDRVFLAIADKGAWRKISDWLSLED